MTKKGQTGAWPSRTATSRHSSWFLWLPDFICRLIWPPLARLPSCLISSLLSLMQRDSTPLRGGEGTGGLATCFSAVVSFVKQVESSHSWRRPHSIQFYICLSPITTNPVQVHSWPGANPKQPRAQGWTLDGIPACHSTQWGIQRPHFT